MAPRLHLLSPLAVLGPALSLTATLSAQDPADLHQPPPTATALTEDLLVGIHGREFADYGLRAAGRTYKVAFDQPDHHGFEFVPYAGEAFEHNQSWRWTTESVRFATEQLARGVTAEHLRGTARSATRYEYDLGGVVEAYDLRSDGVEQTFVIASRPAAGGDLEVVGRVHCPLTATPCAPAHQPLRFTDPAARVTVTYGAATAVDAGGSRYPMTTAWDGRRITLRLDAHAVARARFPLVVDPELLAQSTTETLGETSIDSNQRAIKWVAFTRIASSADHDVFVIRSEDDWANRGTRYADLSSSVSSRAPSVAACGPNLNPLPNAYLAYERRYADRTHLAVVWLTTGAIVHQVLAARVDEHYRNPSLAGHRTYSGVCLAYDRRNPASNTVGALVVDEFVNSRRVTTFPIALASTGVEVAPQVVRDDVWMVLWAENDPSRTTVYSRRISYAGSWGGMPSLDPVSINRLRTGSITITGLRATKDDGPLLLSYVSTPRGLGVRSLTVRALDISGNGGTLLDRRLHSGLGYENGGIRCDTYNPTVATACYTVLNGLSREVRFARIGFDGRVADASITTSSSLPRAPSVCFADADAGDPSQRGEFVAVYGSAASNHPLYGQELPYSILAFDPVVVRGSVDCAGVDELAGFVEPSLAGHGRYFISLPQANGLSAVALGVTATDVPLDALGMTGCRLNVDPILYLNGGPAIQLPLPSSLYGANLYLQWILVEPTANPLGLVSTSSVLARVR